MERCSSNSKLILLFYLTIRANTVNFLLLDIEYSANPNVAKEHFVVSIRKTGYQ
jgi:hypothetical protein